MTHEEKIDAIADEIDDHASEAYIDGQSPRRTYACAERILKIIENEEDE